MMKLTMEQIQEIKEMAIQTTNIYRDEYVRRDQIIEERNAFKKTKEGRILEQIDKLGIDEKGQKAVRELISLLTGVSLPEMEMIHPPVSTFKPLLMVVPTKNVNNHSYTMGAPVMIAAGDMAIDARGKLGNHLEWHRSGLIPATPEQINLFFEVWKKLFAMGSTIDENVKISFDMGDPIVPHIVTEEEDEDSAF